MQAVSLRFPCWLILDEYNATVAQSCGGLRRPAPRGAFSSATLRACGVINRSRIAVIPSGARDLFCAILYLTFPSLALTFPYVQVHLLRPPTSTTKPPPTLSLKRGCGQCRVCPKCGVVDRSGPLKGKSNRIGLYKCYALPQALHRQSWNDLRRQPHRDARLAHGHPYDLRFQRRASAATSFTAPWVSRSERVVHEPRIREAMRQGGGEPMAGWASTLKR